MIEYQERVRDEKHLLDEKTEKLSRFQNGTIFKGLPAEEQMLLRFQQRVMEMYSDILLDRIGLFREASE